MSLDATTGDCFECIAVGDEEILRYGQGVHNNCVARLSILAIAESD